MLCTVTGLREADMPTNLFKSRWFNKAINAIYVQEKQPLVLCILHLNAADVESFKSRTTNNRLTTR